MSRDSWSAWWHVSTLALSGLLLAASGVQAADPPDHTAMMTRGKAVFDHSCVICHGNGPFMAGTQQLRINYGSTEPAMLEQRKDLTPQQVTTFVRNGYGVMPRFRKTEVSDADLAAVAAYLSRNNPKVKQ